MIKDFAPKYNKDLKDDKTSPYLPDSDHEEFSRVEITRKPRRKGVRLYGPFTGTKHLRLAMDLLQRLFQFRTCSLDIKSTDDRWKWFRPLLAVQYSPLYSSVQLPRIARRLPPADQEADFHSGREERQTHQADGARDARRERGTQLREGPAHSRDEIVAIQKLERAGDATTDVQPEVFPIDPKKGLKGLQKVLWPGKASTHNRRHGHRAPKRPGLPLRRWCRFWMGCRSSRVIDASRLNPWQASTTSRVCEVVTRRFRRFRDEDEVFLDILLIDGGKGQLNAALDAFRRIGIDPPCLLSLAKQEEEIFLPGEAESIKLQQAFRRAAVASVRARRGSPIRTALPPHCCDASDFTDE